jgi:hypothetical protein
VARASTGGTFPEVIAVNVATTTTAASTVTANLYTSPDYRSDGRQSRLTASAQSRGVASHAPVAG